MVKEKRILFGLEDIRAIRLRCTGCGGDVLLPRGKPNVPEACPSCDLAWLNAESDELSAEQAMVGALSRIVSLRQRGRRSVEIVLEADDQPLGEGAK